MLVLRSKPQGPPGSSPHIRSISKPHWFYFLKLPRICPLFTTFSATTLTGSHHLLPGPEQSSAPSSLGSPTPPSHPAPPSKSDLPRRLEGACEHLSPHVPLLRPFHGSHLTRDKSPRPPRGPHVPAQIVQVTAALISLLSFPYSPLSRSATSASSLFLKHTKHFQSLG